MLNTLHLFAGAGGGLLADLILGHNPIGAVEWEPYCCDILRQRAADGWFPDLRVHEGDVCLFDPSEYKGRVDIIAAGFPCQDLSLAGNRAGLGEGTRSGLYREVLRIAGDIQPRYIFLENVSAILTAGVGTVLRDLAALGYDCRWTCIPASAAGAPHFRDRWWCLAEDVAHPESIRYREGREVRDLSITHGRPNGCMCPISSGSSQQPENMADPLLKHVKGKQPCVVDSEGWEGQDKRQAGSCGNGNGQRPVKPDVGSVADEFSSHMVPRWWELETDIGRVTGKMKDRVAMLKALGNGQVPLQAALAWVMMGGIYETH